MKRILTYIFTLMLPLSAFGFIMGEKSYRVEVSKTEDHSITLDVINLRVFENVEEAGHWCYQTHQRTEGREVWYSNVVRIDFSEEFTAKEIEEICAAFIRTKVYPSRIRKAQDGGFKTISARYTPGSIWIPKKEDPDKMATPRKPSD